MRRSPALRAPLVRAALLVPLAVVRAQDASVARRVHAPVAAAAPTTTAPPDAPLAISLLLGLYDDHERTVLVLERGGYPRMVLNDSVSMPFTMRGDTILLPLDSPLRGELTLVERDAARHVTALLISGARIPRRALGPDTGTQLVHRPLRPLDELRREALAAAPPVEANRPAVSDLAELVTLDSSIHLDVRYATTHNLFGTIFYSQARAFLQRPAAESLASASAFLRRYGVGLLVHDGYRPWYVTRMFWDAASPEVRPFVADPASGSKHNRGAAVDLSLYDRRTGTPIVMPSTYDETSPRAAADWPGGTSRQRWYRDVLRHAMESHGFTVNPVEWWHFDFHGWDRYPILNTPFETLGRSTH